MCRKSSKKLEALIWSESVLEDREILGAPCLNYYFKIPLSYALCGVTVDFGASSERKAVKQPELNWCQPANMGIQFFELCMWSCYVFLFYCLLKWCFPQPLTGTRVSQGVGHFWGWGLGFLPSQCIWTGYVCFCCVSLLKNLEFKN